MQPPFLKGPTQASRSIHQFQHFACRSAPPEAWRLLVHYSDDICAKTFQFIPSPSGARRPKECSRLSDSVKLMRAGSLKCRGIGSPEHRSVGVRQECAFPENKHPQTFRERRVGVDSNLHNNPGIDALRARPRMRRHDRSVHGDVALWSEWRNLKRNLKTKQGWETRKCEFEEKGARS